MTNLEKYNNAFETIFGVVEDELKGFCRENNEVWTSLEHISLIGEIEDAFDIMFETDDILNLDSYEKGIEILKKYNIAVAGTGYVGLSIATLLAQHNHVTAVDIIPEKVEMINEQFMNNELLFY